MKFDSKSLAKGFNVKSLEQKRALISLKDISKNKIFGKIKFVEEKGNLIKIKEIGGGESEIIVPIKDIKQIETKARFASPEDVFKKKPSSQKVFDEQIKLLVKNEGYEIRTRNSIYKNIDGKVEKNKEKVNLEREFFDLLEMKTDHEEKSICPLAIVKRNNENFLIIGTSVGEILTTNKCLEAVKI